MPRYFYGENAGRPIRVGGRRYVFDILGIAGGTQQGVVQVPDAEVDAFLTVAARWVEEITESEYVAAIEKKKQNPRSQPSPDLTPPPPPGPPLKGRGAVVVDGASIARPPTKEELPTGLDDAIEMGRADTPKTEVQTKVRESKRLNHRQKRGME